MTAFAHACWANHHSSMSSRNVASGSEQCNALIGLHSKSSEAGLAAERVAVCHDVQNTTTRQHGDERGWAHFGSSLRTSKPRNLPETKFHRAKHPRRSLQRDESVLLNISFRLLV